MTSVGICRCRQRPVVYDCVGCDYVRYEALIASMSTQFPRKPQPTNIDGHGAVQAGRVS